MDWDELSINELPNEILLMIFRNLSASEFVTCLPLVCKRWLQIITSDVYTLKRIGMHHANGDKIVKFFYIDNDKNIYGKHSIFENWSDKYERLIAYRPYLTTDGVSYSNAFYLCARYSEIFKHVETLVVSSYLDVYHTQGFTYLNNIKTLVFAHMKIENTDHHAITELGSVYSNIQNVMYVGCFISSSVSLKFLYNGFKLLKQFRLSSFRINHRFLDKLLKTHPTLETIVFDDCTIMSDKWINVLEDRLKGRTVKSLRIHSSYFTSNCVSRFLSMSDLFIDVSNVKIIHDRKFKIPFSMTLVSIS